MIEYHLIIVYLGGRYFEDKYDLDYAKMLYNRYVKNQTAHSVMILKYDPSSVLHWTVYQTFTRRTL